MSSEKHRNYLNDLGLLTKEHSREAIEDYRAAVGTEEESFKLGYMIGFHHIVSLMQQQAKVFEIPLEEIGLADIDENEFLGHQAGS